MSAGGAALSGSGFVTAPPTLPSLGDELPASSQSTLLLQKKKEMAEVIAIMIATYAHAVRAAVSADLRRRHRTIVSRVSKFLLLFVISA